MYVSLADVGVREAGSSQFACVAIAAGGQYWRELLQRPRRLVAQLRGQLHGDAAARDGVVVAAFGGAFVCTGVSWHWGADRGEGRNTELEARGESGLRAHWRSLASIS